MKPSAVVLPRRAVLASALALFASQPLPLLAAPALPSGCSVSALTANLQQLKDTEKLLGDRASWPQAKSLLDAIDSGALEKALEECVNPKTLKEQAMNNAAFIVYYEERRYNDTRLEPQVPSLRAEQNGRKKELLRALADEKAELAFLLKADDDPADLRSFAAAARTALTDFIALVPKPST